MENKKHGKRYTDDFRKIIVDLYHSGQKVKNLSGEYGVSEVTIYGWIKKLNPIELGDGSSVTPEDYAELKNKCINSNRRMKYKKKLWPYSQRNK